MRCTFRVLLIVLAAAPSGQGQGAARRFTTIDALRQVPGFYHLQNVLLRGEIVENGTRLMLRADEQEMRVLLDPGVSTKKGPVEVRGVLIDVGRLEPSDPRATGIAEGREADRWPHPGEELVLRLNGMAEAQAPT